MRVIDLPPFPEKIEITIGRLISLHQPRGPADAHEHSVRT